MAENNALYLSECQGILHEEYLLGTVFFTCPTGDGTTILRGHLSHAKV